MNGGITDPQEFWNALGRLYDSTMELKQSTIELRRVAELHQSAIEHLAQIATAHEKRLERQNGA